MQNQFDLAEFVRQHPTLKVKIRSTDDGFLSDWEEDLIDLQLESDGTLSCSNINLARVNGLHFKVVFVKDVVLTEGKPPFLFIKPISIENSNGLDKVGDVAVRIFEDNKGLYHFLTDKESVYITENLCYRLIRIVRSSLDNVLQAVTQRLNPSGFIWANAARIGGKHIKTHWGFTEWEHWPVKLAFLGKLPLVQNFIKDSEDSLGKAAILNAIVDEQMTELMAFELLWQMRHKTKLPQEVGELLAKQK